MICVSDFVWTPGPRKTPRIVLDRGRLGARIAPRRLHAIWGILRSRRIEPFVYGDTGSIRVKDTGPQKPANATRAAMVACGVWRAVEQVVAAGNEAKLRQKAVIKHLRGLGYTTRGVEKVLRISLDPVLQILNS